MTDRAPPDARLLITSRCPNCAAMINSLLRLLKQQAIGRLEIINLESHPEEGAREQVRAVPWLRLGEFELVGLHSLQELTDYAESSGTVAGWQAYLSVLLATGNMAQAQQFVEDRPEAITALLALLADKDAEINVRVGAVAILEGLQGSVLLKSQADALISLTADPSPAVRADACHLLGLTGERQVKPALEKCLQDSSAEVREIAQESLEALEG